MWAANEKGAFSGDLDFVHIYLGPRKQPWFQEHVYSEGAVPAIADHGVVLGDSALLVEYIESKFAGSGVSLLPADPRLQVQVRAVVKAFDNHGVLGQALMNKDPAADAEKLAAAAAFVRTINAKYAAVPSEGPFLLGSEPSVADAVVLPILLRFYVGLAFYRGFDLLPKDDATVSRLYAALHAARARPAFVRTMPPDDIIVAAQFNMLGGVPPSA